MSERKFTYLLTLAAHVIFIENSLSQKRTLFTLNIKQNTEVVVSSAYKDNFAVDIATLKTFSATIMLKKMI